MQRIIIVGGGFGGVRAALRLANQPGFEVTLISQQTYFECHFALFRSATGRSPFEVTIPLVDFFEHDKNITVVQDEVIGIDSATKTITGSSQSIYHYDSVIFAIGSVANYFNIPGLQELSFGVKTIQAALHLKRHLHEDLASDDAEKNYVVIGGGATGVELAGELVTYVRQIRQKHGKTAPFTVHLIESTDRLLPLLPETFAQPVERHLQTLGVQLHLQAAVHKQTEQLISFAGGEIQSHTVIWTAGMTNHSFFGQHPQLFHLGRGNKVVVNDYLESQVDVYVIGDSALTEFSGMAQTALHDADFVTDNLKRLLKHQPRKTYLPKKPVYAIPAGSRWSAVLWGHRTVYGYVGWLVRRFSDLSLYLRFLPLKKALSTWRYGFVSDETCPHCQ